jgi:hypothetical protein
MGPRRPDSFYGNLSILRQVLAYNGIQNVTVFNARDYSLSQLPGPYDFIYSFYSIGFHWALDDYLTDILALMSDRAVAAFSTPLEFKLSAQVAQVPHRLIEWNTVWPRSGRLKMLLLSKAQIPDWDQLTAPSLSA